MNRLRILQVISPSLYSTFWRLSLYDIVVPRERYADELKRIRRQIDEIDRYTAPVSLCNILKGSSGRAAQKLYRLSNYK